MCTASGDRATKPACDCVQSQRPHACVGVADGARDELAHHATRGKLARDRERQSTCGEARTSTMTEMLVRPLWAMVSVTAGGTGRAQNLCNAGRTGCERIGARC